jgi:hypothetical protein
MSIKILRRILPGANFVKKKIFLTPIHSRSFEAIKTSWIRLKNFSTAATQVGMGRILGGSKFHYRIGQPELSCEEELRWRVGLMEKGLAALETAVNEPKVFWQEIE